MPDPAADDRRESPPLQAETLAAPAGSLPAPGLLYLLVFDERAARMVPLPHDGEVRVGRAAEADISLDDESVSRLHARITVTAGQAVVEDLGSRNGTLVNGHRIEGPHRLCSGETIAVSRVALVFHAAVGAGGCGRVVDFPQLCRRGDEEVARSTRYGRPLTIAVLTWPASGIAPPAIAAAVAPALRLMDLAAGTGGPEVVALLPEQREDEAIAAVFLLLAPVARLADGARAGCATFPEDGDDFGALLASARAAAQATGPGQVAAARGCRRALRIGPHSVLIADPAMLRVYDLIERLAVTDLTVLVQGETGTGKEVVAAAVHDWSERRAGPFLALNCAAVPEALLESELFGHERGAFSGAVASKRGLLEAAAGGTVFLDEVADLSAAAQAKLLRALETRRTLRVGDLHERAIDIRIVAASNRDLGGEVAAGRFRGDLFFRLTAATVWLPPLRDRRRELPLLAGAFLDEACAARRRPPLVMTPAALQALLVYPWPGNVRELKHLMEYLAATVSGDELQAGHLTPRLGHRAEGASPAPEPVARPAAPVTFRPIAEELRELERGRMLAALEAAEGNQTRAARLIAMPVRTFAYKMRAYGLEPPGRTRPRGS